MIYQVCGYLGAGLFSVSGAVLALKVAKTGTANDYASRGVLTIIGGSVFTLIYLLGSSGNLPIKLEMVANIVSWSLILYYHHFPRSKK